MSAQSLPRLVMADHSDECNRLTCQDLWLESRLLPAPEQRPMGLNDAQAGGPVADQPAGKTCPASARRPAAE